MGKGDRGCRHTGQIDGALPCAADCDPPDKLMQELRGKVAIVTGSSRNVGRAIAMELAAAGADVLVNALTSVREAEATADAIRLHGVNACCFIGDVADSQAVGEMVTLAVQKFGRIDILVNNAGLRREQKFEAITLEDWRRVIEVTLDGAFLCAQACMPHLVRAGGGAIVNIGGVAGHVGVRNRAHVVTAKAGLAGFTKALALDLAGHGITVNCVAPARINTPESHSAAPRRHAVKTPLDREGRPEEVAAMVRMLCGPDSRYVTGQTIHVNGGLYMP